MHVTADNLEYNGASPTADQLRALALNGYGHFTAMQVRGGRVRGLDLHLARLDQATDELFGISLDGALVRDYVRHAWAAAQTPRCVSTCSVPILTSPRRC